MDFCDDIMSPQKIERSKKFGAYVFIYVLLWHYNFASKILKKHLNILFPSQLFATTYIHRKKYVLATSIFAKNERTGTYKN